MPKLVFSISVLLFLAVGSVACTETPTAPNADPPGPVFAATRTDPPPPPVTGGEGGGVPDTDPPPPFPLAPHCGQTGPFFADGLEYTYLRTPSARTARLTLHGPAVLSDQAYIHTIGDRTRAYGRLQFHWYGAPGHASAIVDLESDLVGGVMTDPGVNSLTLSMSGQLTDYAGVVCTRTLRVTVSWPEPTHVGLSRMHITTHPAILRYGDPQSAIGYDGTITNSSGAPLGTGSSTVDPVVVVQNWIIQGHVWRSAGEQVLQPCSDGGVAGLLPEGQCNFTGVAFAPNAGSEGQGTLVPGNAKLLIQVKFVESVELGGTRLLASHEFPVQLVF